MEQRRQQPVQRDGLTRSVARRMRRVWRAGVHLDAGAGMSVIMSTSSAREKRALMAVLSWRTSSVEKGPGEGWWEGGVFARTTNFSLSIVKYGSHFHHYNCHEVCAMQLLCDSNPHTSGGAAAFISTCSGGTATRAAASAVVIHAAGFWWCRFC